MLSIDAVLKLMISVFRENFASLFLISLLGMAPLIISEYALFGVSPLIDLSMSSALAHLVSAGVEIISFTLVDILLVYAVLHALSGYAVDAKLSIAWGARRMFLAFGIGIVLNAPGFIPTDFLEPYNELLWFAGMAVWFYILIIFFVALPALIVEESSFIGCLRRSAYLTKDHRWRVFALSLIIAVVSVALELITELVAGSLLSAISLGFAQGLMEGLSNTLFACLSATLTIVLYRELRIVKDEGVSETIAAVFD